MRYVIMLYLIVFLLLLFAELLYFRIAAKCNIVDNPNERSSHSSVVLRGGGFIFSLSVVLWALMMPLVGEGHLLVNHIPFLTGLLLVTLVSFWDDLKSLPDYIRLIVHFVAMLLMFWSMGIMHWSMWWIVALSLFLSVGATNVINFMDGINGITAGYSLTVILSLLLINEYLHFIETSFLIVVILGLLVFCLFNFRPKGKARCFAGDVGSISIAFIMLYAIGRLVVQTQDVTYLILLLVYGVDGCLTICHRILLHENLGQAHRKHAYQIMANELKIGHESVSVIYMCMQLIISLVFIYLIPDTVVAHWIYLVSVTAVLAVSYILFMKKYYHLHEEYLKSLNK